MFDDDWAEKIMYRKYKPKPELPEDILIAMWEKNPMIEELIKRLELELET